MMMFQVVNAVVVYLPFRLFSLKVLMFCQSGISNNEAPGSLTGQYYPYIQNFVADDTAKNGKQGGEIK